MTIDKQLIISILEVPVQQNSCMLEGAECCQFVIKSEEMALSI